VVYLNVPEASNVPDVAAEYQFIVPGFTVAPKVTVPEPHLLLGFGVTVGSGFTVTVIVKVLVQPPEFAVTVYVAVATAAVVLVRICEMLVCGVTCALAPVIAAAGAITGVVHV
jgi:hypothetical protein